MTYEKLLAPFTSTDKTNQRFAALQYIHQSPTHIEATDSYASFRIKHEGDESNTDFPKTEQLYVADPKAVSVLIDARYLEKIAKAFKQYARAKPTVPWVTMEVSGANGCVRFRSHDGVAEALVMPIRG